MRSIGKLKLKSWFIGNRCFMVVLFVALCLILPQSGFAAWGDDPIAVAASTNDERRPQVVYDEAGGYYVTWQDYDDEEIYAQHYSAEGDASWTSPLQLSAGAYSYAQQESTADGSGGLLVAWKAYDGDTYSWAQRVLADGTVAWAEGGVQVLYGGDPWIAADGNGGAILMNYDEGLVNRVAADGSLPWGDADNAISYSDNWWGPKIVSDGNGGAILMWVEEDVFSGIAVQRIDEDGNFVWNSGAPLQLSADGDSVECGRIIPQEGGAFVVWYQSDEILVQKVDSTGAAQWTADGVVAATGQDPYYNIGLASDAAGGVFIVWGDETDYVVRAQYVDTDGSVIWAAPVDMSSNDDYDEIPQHPQFTVADGEGGFITTWANDSDEIVAQRCNAAGEVQWTDTGALIAAGEDIYYGPKLATNRQGGAVMVWVDYRYDADSDTSSTDIMLQAVSASGVAGDPGYTPQAVSAGDDQTVDEGDEVTLNGSVLYEDLVVSYLWEQTAGTTVTLSDASAANPVFTAPEVDADETLTFKLTVTDIVGNETTDECNVQVTDITVDTPDTSTNSSSGGGSSCFLSSVGVFSMTPATGLFFLFTGIVGLATVRRR